MKGPTDWEAYYGRPFIASRLSRRYTRRMLLGMIERFLDCPGKPIRAAELGGGGSCFMEAVLERLPVERYHVVDTSPAGLERSAQIAGDRPVSLHQQDVLAGLPELAGRMDLVLSVGLIEHFDPPGTARAVDAHFDLLRPGGLAVLSYPTPTLPYRLVRGAAEMIGTWKFPDERPLRAAEVLPSIARHGQVLMRRILWPIVLTQEMIAARKA